MKKYYITRYAFTKGVYILENCEDYDGYIEEYDIKEGYSEHEIGREAFSSPEEAIKQVQLLKERKLKSLEKQMKKISALDPETMVREAKVRE